MTEINGNVEAVDLYLKDLTMADSIGQDSSPLPIADTDTDTDTEIILTQQTLSLSDFDVDWESKLNDCNYNDHNTSQLDKLAHEGWLIIDNVFENKALLALQSESGFIDYREAQLTAGVRVSHIRGDKIRWINEDFYAGFHYLHSINELASLFNKTLFAGIRHSEAHYACYPIGFGYQWHSDNPTGRDERVISAVFYLNDDWEPTDGGALEIVDNHGYHHKITPIANRLIVFDSNLHHQVQIAHRQRYSIATWMRRDSLVPFVAE